MWPKLNVCKEKKQRSDRLWLEQTDRRTDSENDGELVSRAEKEGARAAVWQRVCTAEHKLKKPRPLSHTPLGLKLHGVLHSTHKQPPGKALGRMGEAGGTPGWTGKKQQPPFHISTMPPNYRGTRDGDRQTERERGLADNQGIHLGTSLRIGLRALDWMKIILHVPHIIL